MDTIGYAIEEMVYLPSEMKDALRGSTEPKWKKRTKALVFLSLTVAFFLFTAYQSWLTLASYKTPSWSSYQDELKSIYFPGIVLCPTRTMGKRLQMDNAGCSYFDSDAVGVGGNDVNSTSCSYSTAVLGSLEKHVSCFNYNYDAKAIADSPSSFMIAFAGTETKNNSQVERSEDLSKNLVRNRTVIPQFQYPLLMYAYTAENGEVSLSSLKPSAMVSADGTSYVMIGRTDYQYLNGTKETDYSLSISSSPNGQNTPSSVIIYISFDSLRVTVWTQYVAHDWITSSGIIAGLVGFLRSCWYITIIILDRLEKKWENPEGEYSSMPGHDTVELEEEGNENTPKSMIQLDEEPN